MVSELITLPVSGVPDGATLTCIDAPPPAAGAACVAFDAPPSTEVPTKPLAMSSAFCASPADATEPIRMIESATVLTVMSLPGSATLSSSCKLADVAADRHFDRRDLAAVGGEGEDRRLAVGDRGDIEAPRRADHGVGDLRIADEDFGGVLRQIDDDRAADAELQRLPRFARRDDIGVGRGAVARQRDLRREGGQRRREGDRRRDQAREAVAYPFVVSPSCRRPSPPHRHCAAVCGAPNRTIVRPDPLASWRRRPSGPDRRCRRDCAGRDADWRCRPARRE